jgi:hypothetical protein
MHGNEYLKRDRTRSESRTHGPFGHQQTETGPSQAAGCDDNGDLFAQDGIVIGRKSALRFYAVMECYLDGTRVVEWVVCRGLVT